MRHLKLCFSAATIAVLISTSVLAQDNDLGATGAQTSKSTNAMARSQNRQMASAVRHAITKTKQIQTDNIRVLAKGGAVSLMGTVPDGPQIALAENAAENVPGVMTVSNRLTVREAGGH